MTYKYRPFCDNMSVPQNIELYRTVARWRSLRKKKEAVRWNLQGSLELQNLYLLGEYRWVARSISTVYTTAIHRSIKGDFTTETGS